MKVTKDGPYQVSYIDNAGVESSFRCTPEMADLFAAAPDMLNALAELIDLLEDDYEADNAVGQALYAGQVAIDNAQGKALTHG